MDEPFYSFAYNEHSFYSTRFYNRSFLKTFLKFASLKFEFQEYSLLSLQQIL